MNSSKTNVNYDLMVPVVPILGANGAILMDLWKAQMVWTTAVGSPIPPPNPSVQIPVDLKDLLK